MPHYEGTAAYKRWADDVKQIKSNIETYTDGPLATEMRGWTASIDADNENLRRGFVSVITLANLNQADSVASGVDAGLAAWNVALQNLNAWLPHYQAEEYAVHGHKSRGSAKPQTSALHSASNTVGRVMQQIASCRNAVNTSRTYSHYAE